MAGQANRGGGGAEAAPAAMALVLGGTTWTRSLREAQPGHQPLSAPLRDVAVSEDL